MNGKTRTILEDLEAVRENLLALSDDIWLSIDHNDGQALEEGVQFKRAYNEKMAAFDALATDLSLLVQQFTSVRLEASEQSGADDEAENARIVRELNREEPHAIDEDFTFKRPHGFILQGQGASGITTWRRVYELICQHLLKLDAEAFEELPDHTDLISNRGHHQFTRDPELVRSATLIGAGLYSEINLSANALRDVIRKLLALFEIPESDLQIFLREDRNAERESAPLKRALG